jgi:hypothetical protein
MKLRERSRVVPTRNYKKGATQLTKYELVKALLIAGMYANPERDPADILSYEPGQCSEGSNFDRLIAEILKEYTV